MSYAGKVQLTISIKTPTKELAAEAERLLASHASWMAESHPRDGEKALLSYTVSKNHEFSNPLDPSSEPTGATYFVLNEVYESMAGVAAHWELGQQTWKDFGAMVELLPKCDVHMVHGCPVQHSLW